MRNLSNRPKTRVTLCKWHPVLPTIPWYGCKVPCTPRTYHYDTEWSNRPRPETRLFPWQWPSGFRGARRDPRLPPPQLYLCPDCQLFYGEAHAWVMDKQNRHAPHRPRFYIRSSPALKTINRPTKAFIFRKTGIVNVSWENVFSDQVWREAVCFRMLVPQC
jgi:hypothetical protein